MESQKTIKLYVYVDGVNDIPFYGSDAGEYEEFIVVNGEQFVTSNGFVFNVRNVNEQVEIGNFRFDAKRMGGAPTITFTLMYEDCLDNFWSENVYATFNGEKYFLKQTPTSSLSNEDARYKHDVELISERVALDNVYFFDAVKNSAENNDAVSNSATFAFFGNIVDFKNKLNASLRYADMQTVDGDGVVSGWEVVVDDNITSEKKFISFDNAFFSNAIQESYNTFKIPYYFKGKKIHFGYTDNTIAEEFSYGVDDALLSITKSNANYKVVNRVTGVGSSENIPYYYPNNSPKGEIEALVNSSANVRIVDTEKFANEVNLNNVITYAKTNANTDTAKLNGEGYVLGQTPTAHIMVQYLHSTPDHLGVNIISDINGIAHYDVQIALFDGETVKDASQFDVRLILPNGKNISPYKVEGGALSYSFDYEVEKGTHELLLTAGFSYKKNGFASIRRRYMMWVSGASSWQKDGKNIELSSIGLVQEGTPTVGDTIKQVVKEYITPSNVLLPPKYRDSKGTERFYNATNGTYTDYNGEPIVFTNPFVEGHPKEHIITVEDIKPTIKEKRNASNLRIDMFSEFAYDDGDNDETYIDEEDGKTCFKHPYFYGKLRIMDFNLFDHANENQPMTISFTSGDAGACNFAIGATEEYPQMNPVQVDANGNLLKDDNGMVIAGIEKLQPEVTEFQPRQQDTSKYEVWIALKKEEETYGMLMPQTLLRPKACTSATANDGDTFVILGINLPQSYITAAEQKLEKEIIKYMYENNVEKFKFSIKFSRIYFEENPDVLELLDENSRIYVWYNGVRYTLYVTSMSYYMESDGVLPDITVELDDTLSLTQNALQNAISQVKADVGNALGSIDITALATPYFIRKDQDDEANGVVNFKKGIKFGEGGKVTMYDDNSAKLTIEYLEVTKKATFTSLEIQEKTHVGGQILISPAAMTCGEVEELENAYRCYFQTKGQDGNDEIFNQFVVRDQAICQTFNAWGSRYYWRLVVGVGEDYIDLSKTDCDKESDIPMAGDKIIQLGHRNDKSRQAAQVLSAHGETSPSTIMYNGIDNFSLADKEVTGTLWNPATQEPQMYCYGNFFFGNRTKDENGEFVSDFITFQPKKDNPEEKKLFINADVQFGGGSKGLSDLSEWQELQGEVSDAIDGVKKSVQEVQDQIDGVVENWNGEGAPLLTTEPTKSWVEKSDGELIAHINDTYINIEKYENDVDTPTAGHAWRWCQCTDNSITDFVEVTDKDGNTLKLHWHPIADSDAVRALREAAEATRIAEGAARLNLVPNSNELVGYNVNYGGRPLPIRINEGDVFTFKCESAAKLSGNPDSNEFLIGLSDFATEWFTETPRVSFGENVTQTLVVKKGVTNQRAFLHFYSVSEDREATVNFTNFSLVKGTAAMPMWQDYQGDNGLKNLIDENSDEVVELMSESVNGHGDFATLTVNGGEVYTFMAEAAEITRGNDTGFNIGFYDETLKKWVNEGDTVLYVEKGNYVWRTFEVERQVIVGEESKEVILNVPSLETSTEWQHIGTIDATKSYTTVSSKSHGSGSSNTTGFVYDEDIKIVEGPPTYIRIESNTGNVYILHEYNYWGRGVDIIFHYQDYVSKDIINTEVKFKIYAGQASQTAGQTLKLTRASLVKGTRPMMVWKENTDYLTNAFKNGSTKISGGLTMTQAVMVEDESGVVKGMLNGSNYAKDSTHGRLIVAAGSEGSTEAQLSKANTRFYEDGHVESNSLALKEGCVIGGVSVDADGLNVATTDGGTCEFNNRGVEVLNRMKSGVLVSASLGDCPMSGIQVVIGQNGMTCLANFHRRPSAMIVSVPAANEAFACLSGMFSGLRPMTRDVSSGEILNELDYNVFIASGAIYLPSSPMVGQTYKIYHTDTVTLTIHGNGEYIQQMKGSSFQEVSAATSTRIEVIELLWRGAYWFATTNRWE